MAEIILSDRMQALTDMVTPGTVITDVGCDHGFVSVYLVQKGICPCAIAMDVRPGPLARAKEHIREYGLEDRIETRLSDGLTNLKAGEATGMICAGMGGPLMEKILTEGRVPARSFTELILQPQSEIPKFRTFLRDEGYLLLDENIIYEEGKYYFMMKVRWQGEMSEEAVRHKVWGSWLGDANDMDPECAMQYGRLLLQNVNPLLKEYLEKNLSDRKQIEERMHKHADVQNPRTGQRLDNIAEQIRLLEKALDFYESRQAAADRKK